MPIPKFTINVYIPFVLSYRLLILFLSVLNFTSYTTLLKDVTIYK
jgi:hypothetical protein